MLSSCAERPPEHQGTLELIQRPRNAATWPFSLSKLFLPSFLSPPQLNRSVIESVTWNHSRTPGLSIREQVVMSIMLEEEQSAPATKEDKQFVAYDATQTRCQWRVEIKQCQSLQINYLPMKTNQQSSTPHSCTTSWGLAVTGKRSFHTAWGHVCSSAAVLGVSLQGKQAVRAEPKVPLPLSAPYNEEWGTQPEVFCFRLKTSWQGLGTRASIASGQYSWLCWEQGLI